MEEKRDKVAFLLHTQPRDENGTDLPRLVRHLIESVILHLVKTN